MRNSNKLFLSILTAAILLFLNSDGFAQKQSAIPDRGTGGKGTEAASGIDSVNMQSGSLSLAIPLASLPPVAGGKLSHTIYAYYDSKLWNVHQKEAYGTTTTPGCQPRYTTGEPRLDESGSQGGWRISGQYELFYRDARDGYEYLTPTGQTCWGYEYFHMQGNFFKPILRTPDGSEHELRIEGGSNTYPGESDFLKNYYKTSGTPGVFTSTTRLYSTDGTYLAVEVNPAGGSIGWTAYMKDGTRIINYTNGEQRIKDNNGNSILISGGSYKDEQTNREIKVVGNLIQYKKVGGEWASVELGWGTTLVQGKLYSTTDWNPSYNGNESGFQTCGVYRNLNYGKETMAVLREIILPATESGIAPKKYSFSYNSDTTSTATTTDVYRNCGSGQTSETYTRTVSDGLGELSEVIMPDGAKYQYEYKQDGHHDFGYFGDGLDIIAANAIVKKKVVHDGETDTWNYTVGGEGGYVAGGSVVNPDGSTYEETFYPTNPLYNRNANTNGLGGLTYRTITGGNQTGDPRIMTEKRWFLMGGSLPPFGSSGQQITFNPLVDTEFTSWIDAGGNRTLTKATKYVYDYNGELLQTVLYDWFDPALLTIGANNLPEAIPAGAQVLRTVNNNFYNQATDSNLAADANSANAYRKRTLGASPLILGAIKETSVGNSQMQFSYDNQSYGVVPTVGNPTKVSVYDSTKTIWLDTTTAYNSYGNVISTTDPKGNTTNIYYEDSSHLMPTKTIVDPNNGTGQQITTATYDSSTGLPLTSTDVNGNTSSIDYTNHLLGAVDPFGRSGTTYSPYRMVDGVSKRSSVKIYYEDNARKTRVEADLYNEGDALIKSRTSRDQMGRAFLSEKNENGANIYTISSETIYKTQERAVMSSNPHRSSASTTDGWTRATSDALGRTFEVRTFAGAAQPPTAGTNSTSTGVVITAFDKNATTVTDQAGKQRRSVSDGIGQLTRVDEPNASGVLGTITAPNQPTSYSYDNLGNLATVVQTGTSAAQCGGAVSNCTQTRTFTYNSMSQLVSANNPESGLISYEYDDNGNLTKKTDGRGVKTNYTYDAFNRVLTRSYADEPQGQAATPAVSYTYENLSIANSKGRLTKVENANSKTEYQVFDIFGRVTQSQQTTDGAAYGDPMTYKYNLSGALIEQKYPSGRVVKNVLDADGDLSIVQSKKNANSGYFSYAKSFTYNAAGAVTSMQLGNGKWESTQFNSRLQPTQIALGTVQNGTDKLKLNFDYGTANNNGNVLSQTITVPTTGSTPGFTAIQTYNYDELNRLKSAEEKISNVTSWKQTYTFDRYGNRRFDEANTDTIETSCPTAVCNPTVDPATNKLIGYTFDNAGNTKVDAQGKTFTYDAENKQTKVVSNGNTIGEYFYDGDGKRVKKVVGNEVTIFVYDASGKMIAEYASTVVPQAQARVSYLTNDHLGSPRITTDADGKVFSRRDFMPFGEEIDSTDTPQRNVNLNYGEDGIKQKFTSYERDNETDLDFAQARYYKSAHGRFTSVDPIMITKKRLRDPQSINLYAYSRNNPLKYVDPTGEYFVGANGKGRVAFKINDNGKIVLGKNASADLVRMARLINKTGSETALAQFAASATNETKNHFKIESKEKNNDLLGLHQAHDKNGKPLKWEAGADGTGKFDGKPAYIKDKDGNMVYKEATITVYEGNITKGELEAQQRINGDPNLTKSEVVVGVFSHEVDHNTNQEAIDAIRDRQEGRPNNLDVEQPADEVEREVFEEIKKKRP